MRKFLLFIIVVVLLASMTVTVNAAPPPDGPPGLERAIQVKDRHADVLLKTPGVAGVGVGLNDEGKPAVIIFTKTSGVKGLPTFLDDVPAVVRVSGEFVSLARPGKGKNNPPTVIITSPVNGATYSHGQLIHFEGTASDKENGNLTGSLRWSSDKQGPIGTGGSFDRSLNDGTHIITASVTDSGGKTGSASVTIKVGTTEPTPHDRWPRPVPIGSLLDTQLSLPVLLELE